MEMFKAKRVFITGGSSGIGEAMAIRLASYGAHVWIAARGKEKLEAALGRIQGAAGESSQRFGMSTLDVSNKADVERVAQEVIEGLGGIDIVVNNAGIAHPATVMETPDDIFTSMMDVNYFGTVHVTRAFLPALRAQKSGHICNVSSMLGFMGIYGYTAYAASKHAVVGFSDCLRQELIGDNIGLPVVFPPDTDTPQLAAENRIKPPETKAIAGEVKMMSADEVAMCCLRGIIQDRYLVVPGAMGTFTHFMYRHVPSVVRWVIDGELKKYRKNNAPA